VTSWLELTGIYKAKMSAQDFEHQFLRPINEADLESLRRWKNEHRSRFFYREYITRANQNEWYSGYKERTDDHMFNVLASNTDIVGCMGIRWESESSSWDVYNVIRGSSIYKGSGVMSLGLCELIRFALNKKVAPITLVVLKDNPAVGWYARNGFTKLRDDGQGVLMCFNRRNEKES